MSAEPQEGQDGQDNDHQAHEIDDAAHGLYLLVMRAPEDAARRLIAKL
jgi:hypothetical protein